MSMPMNMWGGGCSEEEGGEGEREDRRDERSLGS